MYLVMLLISGVISALPLIFSKLFFISWLSMIPLFWICYKEGPRFRYFLMFGAGYFGLSYHWFAAMYPLDFAGFSKVTGAFAVAVCWIGLALLQTLWISLSAPLMRLCQSSEKQMRTVDLPGLCRSSMDIYRMDYDKDMARSSFLPACAYPVGLSSDDSKCLGIRLSFHFVSYRYCKRFAGSWLYGCKNQ